MARLGLGLDCAEGLRPQIMNIYGCTHRIPMAILPLQKGLPHGMYAAIERRESRLVRPLLVEG